MSATTNGTKSGKSTKPKIAIVPDTSPTTATSEDVQYDEDMCRALGIEGDVHSPPGATDVAVAMLKALQADLDVLNMAMYSGQVATCADSLAKVIFHLHQRAGVAIEMAERLQYEAAASTKKDGAP